MLINGPNTITYIFNDASFNYICIHIYSHTNKYIEYIEYVQINMYVRYYSRIYYFIILLYFYIFSFCLFAFSRAAPVAYGSSQARDLIGATAAGLYQSHSNARSEPRLPPHGNAGSLTHWARPRIKPTTSWFLFRYVSAAPQWELPMFCFVSNSRL